MAVGYKPARDMLSGQDWSKIAHADQLRGRFWQFRESVPGISEPLQHNWTFKRLQAALAGLQKQFGVKKFNGLFDFFRSREKAFPAGVLAGEEHVEELVPADDDSITEDPFRLWRSRWPNFFSVGELLSRSCFGSWSRKGRLALPASVPKKLGHFVDELASGGAAFRAVIAELTGLEEKEVTLPINVESDQGFVQHTLQAAVNLLLEQLRRQAAGLGLAVAVQPDVSAGSSEQEEVSDSTEGESKAPLFPPVTMVVAFRRRMEEIVAREGGHASTRGRKSSTDEEPLDYDALDDAVLRVALTHLHYQSLLHVLRHRLNYHRADLVSKVTRSKQAINAHKMATAIGSSVQFLLHEFRASFKAGQVQEKTPPQHSDSAEEAAPPPSRWFRFPLDRQCFVLPLTWVFRKWLPKNLDRLSSQEQAKLREMYFAGPEEDDLHNDVPKESSTAASSTTGAPSSDNDADEDEEHRPSPLRTSFPRDISLLSPDGKLELHSPSPRMDYHLEYTIDEEDSDEEDEAPRLALFPAHLATTQRATEDSRQKLAEDDVAYDFVSNGLSFCDELSDKHDINRGRPQYRVLQFEVLRKSHKGVRTVLKTAAIVFKLRDAERLFGGIGVDGMPVAPVGQETGDNRRPAVLEILFEWRDRISLESCFFDEEYRWTEFCRRKRYIAEEHSWVF